MSIFWPSVPAYAETHFKFKLPWSLLYRPWPEVFADAPFQFVPGVEPFLFIVVRDGDRFPVKLLSVEVSLKCAGSVTVKKFELGITPNSGLEFHELKLGELAPGRYEATAKIVLEKQGRQKVVDRWNYPGLKPRPLKFEVLAEALPRPEGFLLGEMHCHTHYSSDHVEFGATPQVLQQAAGAVGLDFVCLTDHAYDFAFRKDDYTKEAPSPRFDELRREVAELPSYPLMLAGEEVSAGNSKGENVHMLAFAPEAYLPGLGDCGRYWLNNHPTKKIGQLLTETKAHCFAAHPKQLMGELERFVFRRGYWSANDLFQGSAHPIRGLQFWNGVRDAGFNLGKELWLAELGKGNFLLPIGGNDAHGDLNCTTSVKLPLFKLRATRNHIFGKVRTGVQCGEATLGALNEAFAGENVYITEGPALSWERSGKNLLFHAKSNEQMGAFRYIKIFGRRLLPNGKLAETEELHGESRVAAAIETHITAKPEDFAYLRAEAETANGKFALTSAAKL